jgi:hypothetical protein
MQLSFLGNSYTVSSPVTDVTETLRRRNPLSQPQVTSGYCP